METINEAFNGPGKDYATEADAKRARLPVRERHLARIKHERRMRAHATSGRSFPYNWAWN
jgi:hypothetical protein